jgi:hypothetical protein
MRVIRAVRVRPKHVVRGKGGWIIGCIWDGNICEKKSYHIKLIFLRPSELSEKGK